MEQSTGIRPPELDYEECPAALSDFWGCFLDLHRQRPADGAIAYGEILAYSRLTGRAFSPLEVRAIVELDGVWREERAKWRTS